MKMPVFGIPYLSGISLLIWLLLQKFRRPLADGVFDQLQSFLVEVVSAVSRNFKIQKLSDCASPFVGQDFFASVT